MENVRVKSRFETAPGERCPKCSMLNQNVIDYGVFFGCINCGTVFVPNQVRQYVRENIVELLKASKNKPVYNKVEKTEPDEIFKCSCGFEAKSKAGLIGHQRFCEQWVKIDERRKQIEEQI